MSVRSILTILGVIIMWTAQGQDKYTISGYIKSDRTGESLINASIELGSNATGTSSNEYGFYSLTVPAGDYEISYSAIGYAPIKEKITLKGNLQKNMRLTEQVQDLENVTVTAHSRGRSIAGTQMGVERLTMKDVESIPMFFGERDILKAIQFLPGIKPAGEGSSGFYVRGGSIGQNLILLDEATVYNASHLLGFFSTFNPEMIKDITIFKGAIPAQYGGRLSSVLDIKMNEGNNQRMGMSGGIGLISTKLNLEGPIRKDRSSFLVSGRRTYADLFLGLSKDTLIKKNRLYFYDLNAKMNFDMGKKDKLFISGYLGRDYLRLDKQFSIDWGNATGTLRWNHIFSNRVFSNTSLIYSNFDYNIQLESTSNHFNIYSEIRDINLKQEFQWFPKSSHALRFGFNSIYHALKPGQVTSSDITSYNNFYLQDRYGWENAVFFTDTWKTANWLNLTWGLRLSSFSILGLGNFYNVDKTGRVTDTLHYNKGQLVKNYLNPEPRLAASFILNNQSSIKTSYGRNVQNLHLISNSATNTPTDKWLISTNVIKPEISDQYSLGYYRNLKNNVYEFTTEVYYKATRNEIDYRSGADVFTNDAIESQVLFGIGRAYGWEIMLRKNRGAFTGWINYTLSKTERKIDGINDNEWYNARQDRTHDINIVLNYQLNKNWNFSANWVYYTGDAVTFPAGKYVVDNQIALYYGRRNASRMPDYHRLDLGITRQFKKRRNFSSELAFGLFNAYARENAYLISFRQNKDDPSRTDAVQTSLFKLVPSISYNFKF